MHSIAIQKVWRMFGRFDEKIRYDSYSNSPHSSSSGTISLWNWILMVTLLLQTSCRKTTTCLRPTTKTLLLPVLTLFIYLRSKLLYPLSPIWSVQMDISNIPHLSFRQKDGMIRGTWQHWRAWRLIRKIPVCAWTSWGAFSQIFSFLITLRTRRLVCIFAIFQGDATRLCHIFCDRLRDNPTSGSLVEDLDLGVLISM